MSAEQLTSKTKKSKNKDILVRRVSVAGLAQPSYTDNQNPNKRASTRVIDSDLHLDPQESQKDDSSLYTRGLSSSNLNSPIELSSSDTRLVKRSVTKKALKKKKNIVNVPISGSMRTNFDLPEFSEGGFVVDDSLREIVDEMEADIGDVVFDSPDNEEKTIYVADSTEIKATTFEILILKLTQENTDISMNSDFLLTYHDFRKPAQLLILLKKRLVELDGEKSPSLRVFNLVKQWLKNNFYDWLEDSDLMELLLHDIREISKNLGMASYGDLLLNLYQRQRGKYSSEKIYDNDGWGTKTPPTPIVPKKYDGVLSFNPEEVARQLTLIESVLFRQIKPFEIFSKGWMSKDKGVKAPGITLFIQHFNRITFWVSTEVLKRETPKQRAEVILYFLEVAEYCKELNNFNGCFEIFSGINSAPLSRLHKTWDLISEDHKNQIEEYTMLFDRASNYAEFRKTLKLLTPPCIPYIGVYLSDITMISDGGKDEINGLINFVKRRQVAHVLVEVMHLQQTSYCLLYVPELRDEILTAEAWDENTQYDYASFREPRPGKDPIKPEPICVEPPMILMLPLILSIPSPNPSEYKVKVPKFKRKKRK